MTNDHLLDFSFVLAASVHDMKNSLGMLLNSLEEVMGLPALQQPEQRKHVSTLQYEASRINSELIQLLTIYRLNQQNLPVNIDEHYISDTFEDQLARNDMLFVAQSIEVTVDCDGDLAWFYDAELMGNVIHNVVINAVRYAQQRICLSAEVENDDLVIKIEDDGNGFPQFMLDEYPLDCPGKPDANSTQLGLFFASRIAHFHRQGDKVGHIALSNGGTLGGGVFRIYLP
ncbi:MAG: HAMP domain-containing histidine kinase [Gammaproteobacteria bacterium]|nr:HAMP domain-containing histidine kinase [Gammaproteobacteria bacterium]